MSKLNSETEMLIASTGDNPLEVGEVLSAIIIDLREIYLRLSDVENAIRETSKTL
jgi:hypothetical protein